MKVTKLGHCCLLIEVNGQRVLTDPGAFSTTQNDLTGIDLILISHEHADHLHVDSLRAVLQNNPTATVITNSGVGKILTEHKIPFTLLEGTATTKIGGLTLMAFDAKHEEVWQELASVHNTGYLIAGKLYYPGDAFSNPGQPVEVLALPVAGPWCRVRDAITYALSLQPKHVFPVHDGMLQADKVGSAHFAPSKVLSEKGIDFVGMNPGDSHEF